MGWEYSDTDCKFANVCSYYPRCIAKSEKQCELYRKDNRTFLQKLFEPRDYNEKLKEEFDYIWNGME